MSWAGEAAAKLTNRLLPPVLPGLYLAFAFEKKSRP